VPQREYCAEGAEEGQIPIFGRIQVRTFKAERKLSERSWEERGSSTILQTFASKN